MAWRSAHPGVCPWSPLLWEWVSHRVLPAPASSCIAWPCPRDPGHTPSPSWTSQMYSRGFGFWVRSRETQGQRDFGVLTNGEFLVVHEASYGRFSPFQSCLLISFNPLGPSTRSQ